MNDRYYFDEKRDPVKAHDNDYIYDDRLGSGLPIGILSLFIVAIASVAGWFVNFFKIKP